MGQNIFFDVLFSQANVLPIIIFERYYDSAQCINAVKQMLIEDKNVRGTKILR